MATNEILEAIQKLIAQSNRVVDCPETPFEIRGITTGAAYQSGDNMGIITKLEVPKSGVIYSATFWDMDDEGLQYDLVILKHGVVQVADNSPWAPIDQELLGFIAELSFVSFDDHGGARTSSLTNIGQGYVAPEGFLYIQCVVRGAHNIAAGNLPRFQLQILPTELDW